MMAKWVMGFRCVNGWTHYGMASIGVKAPDSIASGGLTKKLMSWVWLAERARVETNVLSGGEGGVRVGLYVTYDPIRSSLGRGGGDVARPPRSVP